MRVLSSSIELKGLMFRAGHGISEQEQRVGCNFRVNLRLYFSIEASALEQDQLDGTLDYSKVYEVVCREFKPTVHLIEHAAWRVTKALMDEFKSIQTVEITVEKLNPPISADCESAAIQLKIDRK